MIKEPLALWTSLEAAVITGGRNTAEWRATGVCINAAEIKPGDLFFAVNGDDLDEVFRKGAAAAVVGNNAAEREGRALLKVADVFEALQALGRAARFKTHAYVLAAQGQAARGAITETLSKIFDLHPSCRNISMGLAAMPEGCDFAVFGFAPMVKPDIAVVTDCKNVDSSVFESMPASGRVMINADCEGVLDAIAKAKAAGIRNIFTFGRAADSDAVLVNELHAGNGVRVKIKILSEQIEFVLPAGETMKPEMLAAALVMKLSEIPSSRIAQIFSGAGETGAETTPQSNLALIDRLFRNPVQAAFRVTNMIDLGKGRRTAILDNVTIPDAPFAPPNKDLEIPRKLDSLNLVYASKGLSLFSNAESAIRAARPAGSLEQIASQALAPGDFVTFKGVLVTGVQRRQGVFSSALRLIGAEGKRTLKTDHAL